MKIKETFVIVVTRTRAVTEQYYDEILEDVSGDLENTKQHLTNILEKEGFKGEFISETVGA